MTNAARPDQRRPASNAAPQPPPTNGAHAPAPAPAPAEQPSLEDAAPVRILGPLEIKPKTSVRLVAHAIGPKGIAIDVALEGVVFDSPEGAAQRAFALEAALIGKGFKPLPAPAAPAVANQAPAAAGAASGEATWIKGEDGRPPRCSVHGPGEWKEGTSGPQAKNPGQPYAFWACKTRNCKPKGSAT